MWETDFYSAPELIRSLYFFLLFFYQATWLHAIEKAKAMPDPWAQFHLEEIATEPCIRYRSDFDFVAKMKLFHSRFDLFCLAL